MSDHDNAANKNYYRRIAEELREADDPVVKAQLQLDHWVESQRALDEELNDSYMVGGFLEHWSQTPSFTKAQRDRDWRVR
jgi:hypothetical protein